MKKQTLLSIFLQELSEEQFSKVDFLLYIGADTSDEPCFEQLKELTKAPRSKFFSPDCSSFLCILGKKPSKADFYVDEQEKLSLLINKLGQETKKRKKNRSYNNLAKEAANDHEEQSFDKKGFGKANGFSRKQQSTVDVSSLLIKDCDLTYFVNVVAYQV